MRFRLAPRSMTLDDLELYKFRIFRKFRGISQISDATTAKRMKIDQYCQPQRCKHVELEQFWACFCVAQVYQRQLGFLVYKHLRNTLRPTSYLLIYLLSYLHWNTSKINIRDVGILVCPTHQNFGRNRGWDIEKVAFCVEKF